MGQSHKLDANPMSASLALDELGLTPQQRAALLQSLAASQAHYEARKAIPGEDVLAWIRSWGTKNPLPAPKIRLG